MPQPLVSIVMPAFNAERFVALAIESISNQTFTDWELIVIDDGSLDSTWAIVDRLAGGDDRIACWKNTTNQGVVATRNTGLLKARGTYIAMMDADDVAYPAKLEKQVRFLNENPGFGMVGSWVRFVDAQGQMTGKGWKLKAGPNRIPSIMLFRNYFVQSTVVMRREAIPEGGYKPGFEIGEDYMMWIEISQSWKVANLPEYLLQYRIHGDNLTLSNNPLFPGNLKSVFFKQFSWLGMEVSDEEYGLHQILKEDRPIGEIGTLEAIEKWLMKILVHNSRSQVFRHSMLQKEVRDRWFKACKLASGLGPAAYWRVLVSPISRLGT